VERGGKEPSSRLALSSFFLLSFLSVFFFYKDFVFLQEFCCSVLHTSLGGEGGQEMFYLCERKHVRLLKKKCKKKEGEETIVRVWGKCTVLGACSHPVTTLTAVPSTVMDFLFRLQGERRYRSSWLAPLPSVQMSGAFSFCHMGYTFLTLQRKNVSCCVTSALSLLKLFPPPTVTIFYPPHNKGCTKGCLFTTGSGGLTHG